MSSPLLQAMEEIALGDGKPRTDSEAKRHHFVPEFLLHRFSVERNGRLRVLQLDLATGKPVWVDPGTAASRKRLYALPDEAGGTHNLLESYFAVGREPRSSGGCPPM